MKKLIILGICIASVFPVHSQKKAKMIQDIGQMHNPKYALFYVNHTIPVCPIVGENIDKVGKINELVARKDYDVSKDWQPRQIMGKDFWHILGENETHLPTKGKWVGRRCGAGGQTVVQGVRMESGNGRATVPESTQVSFLTS